MKKLVKIIALFVIGITALSCSTSVCGITTANTKMKQSEQFDEWTGTIRIEGESETVWKGTVTFSNSIITALNSSSGEMEDYEIPYPSALGALDEASQQGGFSYSVVYYSSWDAFYVTAIGDDSAGEKTGWVFWVDTEYPLIDPGHYELTSDNSEVLWGFLYFENWETVAHFLTITVDEQTVKKNEEFTVTVYNESMSPVEDAIVHIDSMTFTTDENGEVTTSIGTKGTYTIYAEKDPTADDTYIRSDKEQILVKKGLSRSSVDLFERFPLLQRLLSLPIFEKLVGLQYI
jgi:hypothetical protein